MKAIFFWTLWSRRWYIFWWSLGVGGFMALVVVSYPPFRDQAASFNEVIDQLPDAIKALAADTTNFLSPAGYMSSQAYYIVLPIIFGIMSIGLGSSLVASEEESHTLELLLSRPISRGRILAGKALAGIGILFVVTAVTIIITLLIAQVIDLGIAPLHLIVVTFVSALLALIFGSLSFCLTAIGHMPKVASIGIATLLFIASYLFTSLSGTVNWLETPATLLPYHYYHPTDIMHGTYHLPDIYGMAVAILVLGLVAYIGFRRRDIQ